MTGTLIEPNLHAAIVFYPVALITLGIFLELFSFLWSRSSARTAGRWMIVFGVLAAIPAMTTGLYALRQTVNMAAAGGEAWDAIAGNSTWTDAQWDALGDHITYTASGALLMLIGIVVWIASSDSARTRLYLLGMVIMLIGTCMVIAGAHEGGELVYQHATGVRLEAASASADALKFSLPLLGAVRIPYSVMELHTLLAGLSIAFIAAALGLSVRCANVAWENRFAEEKAVAAGYRPAGRMGQEKNLLSIPTLYPGWFWLLALLLVSGTIGLGLYMFDVWKPLALYNLLKEMRHHDEWRPVLHGYTAMTIFVLVLALGIILRFWSRRRFIMGVLCTLLLLAIAVQAWTGILMLFDGGTGPLTRFNTARAELPRPIETPEHLPPVTRPASGPIPLTPAARSVELPATGPVAAPVAPAGF